MSHIFSFVPLTLTKIPLDIHHILSYSIVSLSSHLLNKGCRGDGLWCSFFVISPVTANTMFVRGTLHASKMALQAKASLVKPLVQSPALIWWEEGTYNCLLVSIPMHVPIPRTFKINKGSSWFLCLFPIPNIGHYYYLDITGSLKAQVLKAWSIADSTTGDDGDLGMGPRHM